MLWGATLANVNDPAQRKPIEVVIARSVLQSRLEGLLGAVRDAVDSNGKTAIQMFLDDQHPPQRVFVSSSGVHAVEPE